MTGILSTTAKFATLTGTLLGVAMLVQLPFFEGQTSNEWSRSKDNVTPSEDAILLAQTQGSDRRQDRRDDRQDDRGDRQDDRQDCRQAEGAGKDKRDCKQDGRQDRNSDG